MKEWRCLSALLLLSLSLPHRHTHKLTCVARRSFPPFFLQKACSADRVVTPSQILDMGSLVSPNWAVFGYAVFLKVATHTYTTAQSLALPRRHIFPSHLPIGAARRGAADTAARCRCGAVCCRSEASPRCCGRRYVTAQSKELIWLFGGLLRFPW